MLVELFVFTNQGQRSRRHKPSEKLRGGRLVLNVRIASDHQPDFRMSMLFLPRHDHTLSARFPTKETLIYRCLSSSDRSNPRIQVLRGSNALSFPTIPHTHAPKFSCYLGGKLIVHVSYCIFADVWHIRRCHEPLPYFPGSDPSLWL